jgi:hypothetical protein
LFLQVLLTTATGDSFTLANIDPCPFDSINFGFQQDGSWVDPSGYPNWVLSFGNLLIMLRLTIAS